MITVASMFRDSTKYLDRYFRQIANLRERTDVRVVVAEGDSTDGTPEVLGDWLGADDLLIDGTHGGVKFPSVDNTLRWQQIASVVRKIVDAVPEAPETFLWVESDLIWGADAMMSLVKNLDEVDAVSPMVYKGGRDRFYDTWGFRRDGKCFAAFEPHYPPTGRGLVKIDSCGSCFAANPHGWPAIVDWDGMWPFTADGRLWLDPTLRILHP